MKGVNNYPYRFVAAMQLLGNLSGIHAFCTVQQNLAASHCKRGTGLQAFFERVLVFGTELTYIECFHAPIEAQFLSVFPDTSSETALGPVDILA